MVRTIDLINHTKAFADAGIGVDADKKYGTQCVDEVNDLSITFFGRTLWGNAIDLLNSARDAGYEVVYNVVGDVSSAPRAGAAFVQDSDGYTMRTIEQNIDGNADSLYVGGPARYNTRNFDGIVGWFYFPVDDQPAQVEPITPSEPLTVDSNGFNPETGTFTVEVPALNVRASAGLAGEIVAVYTAGQEINYDGWLDNDGYIWITYIGASGNRRYVAVGQSENGQRVTDFGSFS